MLAQSDAQGDTEQVTLDDAARRDRLWRSVTDAVRSLPDVRQVIVSDSKREITVIGNGYEFVALRDVA